MLLLLPNLPLQELVWNIWCPSKKLLMNVFAQTSGTDFFGFRKSSPKQKFFPFMSIIHATLYRKQVALDFMTISWK